MSTRDAMGFPSNPSDGQPHEGWEWDGEKWVAVGSEIDANIEDGTTDGQITTWAGDKWSPNDAVTVDANGNVGIGTDSPASVATGASRVLDITATSTDAAVLKLKSANGGWELGSWEGSYAGTFGIFNEAQSDFPLILDSSGNVGIGRSDPKANLHVESPSDTQVRINSPASSESTVQVSNADRAWKHGVKAGGSYFVRDVNAALDRLVIDVPNGNATFSGTVTTAKTGGSFFRVAQSGVWAWRMGINGASQYYISNDDYSFKALTLEPNTGNATFSGIVTVEGNRPVSTKADLIETLSTLRNATKDETTLEGMRDALADAIGGLIENLEHEISTMPAEVEE